VAGKTEGRADVHDSFRQGSARHIDLTTATSYLKVPKGFLPDFLQKSPYTEF